MSPHPTTRPRARQVLRLHGWQVTLGWGILIALTIPWWIGAWVLATWAL